MYGFFFLRYKVEVEESKEEEAERLSAWEKYLEGEDDDDSSSKKVSEGMAF